MMEPDEFQNKLRKNARPYGGNISRRKEEYEDISGRSFDEMNYPKPDSAPPELRGLVSTIMFLEAESQQITLNMKMGMIAKANTMVMLTETDLQLSEEIDRLDKIKEIWKPFANLS